jgi:hypothetical protein
VLTLVSLLVLLLLLLVLLLLLLLLLLCQVGDNVILADEMGLGKTIQSIAFLGALWQVRIRLVMLLMAGCCTIMPLQASAWPASCLHTAVCNGSCSQRCMWRGFFLPNWAVCMFQH